MKHLRPLLFAALLVGCGGGGDVADTSDEPCASCGTLIEQATLTTAYPYAEFAGWIDAYGHPYSPPTGAVSWTNYASGRSGASASEGYPPSCGFFGCSYWFFWRVQIPLVDGPNRIRITVGEETDEVTVTYISSWQGLALRVTQPDASLDYETFSDLIVLEGDAPGWQADAVACVNEVEGRFDHCGVEEMVAPDHWTVIASLQPGLNRITLIGFDGFGKWASQPLNVTFRTDQANPVSAVSDSASVAINSSGALDVLANDGSANGYPLAVKAVGAPGHGTASVRADGLIEYTPVSDYEGADQFSYIVTDAHGGTAQGVVSVWVSIPRGMPMRAVSDPDRAGCTTTAWNSEPDVSASGRWITFVTCISPWYAYEPDIPKVMLYDLMQNRLTEISVGSDGTEADDWSGAPAISADGRFVAFLSRAGNLTGDKLTGDRHVFLRDIRGARTVLASPPPCVWDESWGAWVSCGYRDASAPSISADGQDVAFFSTDCDPWWGCPEASNAGDFLYQRYGPVNLVPTARAGDQPAVSATGRLLAYVDRDGWLYVRDRYASQTTAVCQGCSAPSISHDERQLVFLSTAALVPEDINGVGDVYVREIATGATTRASVADGGTEADGPASAAAISADGRFVAFASDATNLVPGDTNGRSDVFVRDRTLGRTIRASLWADGSQSSSASSQPAITATGEYVVFTLGGTVMIAPNLLAEAGP